MSSDLPRDSVTVLISTSGKHAGKRFSINKKNGNLQNRSYGNETHFSVASIAVGGIAELARALEKIARNPYAFVIRGEPLPSINRKYTLRRSLPNKKTGEPATFAEAPRRWILVDVDKISCPAAIDPKSDPEGAVEYVIGLLPPEFHDASCFWKFSSSQSVDPRDETLSLHLWFWLEAPLTGAELKRWAITVNRTAGYKLVDPALFSAVQAHYLVPPTFGEGLRDPLPRRSGLRQGLDEAVCLIIPEPAAKHADQPSAVGYMPGIGVDAWLEQIGGPFGTREAVKKAIGSWVAIHGIHADAAPLKAAIRATILKNRPGVELGHYEDDEHLDKLIEWTRTIHGDQPPKGFVGEPPQHIVDSRIPIDPPADLDGENERARWIAAFNAQYAVVNEAGKAMIYERAMDPLRQRKALVRITFEDFRKLYLNRTIKLVVDGHDKTYCVADLWLGSSRRRQYLAGVIFDPTNKAPPSYWNLWSGFIVAPAAGDWGLIQDHVRRVICGGDLGLAEYLFNFIARMFQEPNRPGEVAIVLRGDKGAGKGIFLLWLVRAWGQHGIHVTNAKHLVGNFNAHLRDCVALFADEAFYAGDRQHEGILKALITEPTIPIEAKFQNTVEVPNMLHIFMSSNSDWVVPASADERRYVVIDVADNRIGDRKYFAELARQMENGGLAAMIHDMLGRDLTGFEVRDVPQTEALKVQKTLSLPTIERWWLTVLSRGFLWKSRHGAPWFRDWHDFYATELLHRSYLQWCDETRPLHRQSREQLGAFFIRVYQASRPRGEHPVYEIDSIDRRAVDVVTDANTGTVTTIPKPLDEISIVYKEHPYGYDVGELVEARVRFTEVCDVVTDWELDPEE